MIIIISPAKTLEFNKKNANLPVTKPCFMEEAKELVSELRTFDEYSLSKLMKTSSKLTILNKERFEVWNESLDNTCNALLAFKGEAYKGIDSGSYDEEDYFYANDHLRILSGLYGALRPLDGIHHYRLEMGTKLKFKNYKNLYDFWDNTLCQHLYDELKKDDKILVNLASHEYFKSVEKIKEKEDITVITPVFKDYKDGDYKVITIKAKRARGLMTSYIIKNKITSIEDIKKFNIEGYEFNEDFSEDNELVFTRENRIFDEV